MQPTIQFLGQPLQTAPLVLALIALLVPAVGVWWGRVLRVDMSFFFHHFLLLACCAFAGAWAWGLLADIPAAPLAWFPWQVPFPLYSLGAMVGTMLGVYLFAQHRSHVYADFPASIAPILLIGMGGALAGHMAGSLSGTATFLPWGIRYDAVIDSPITTIDPLHPVALYLCAGYVLLAAAYTWWWHRVPDRTAFYLFWLWVGVLHLVLLPVLGDGGGQALPLWRGHTALVAGLVMVCAIALFIRRR